MSEGTAVLRSITLREPCKKCGATAGYIIERGGQDVVRCDSPGCETHQYNAPRTETGRAIRTVETDHDAIRAKQRARILERDGLRCFFCGHSDRPLHVGHLLSVRDGLEAGLLTEIINSDENLAASCDSCNLGQGAASVTMRTLMLVALRRVLQRGPDGTMQ